MGKATVDILLPNIDIDDPAMSTLKVCLDSLLLTVRDFAINALAGRF